MQLVESKKMLNIRPSDGFSELFPFFPQQLPDETLYSLVARFYILNGRLRVTKTLSLLFGSPNHLSLHTLLPNGLGYLNNLLTAGTDINGLYAIERFTCLPYFRPFLQDSQYETASRALLTRTNNVYIRSRLGLRSFHSSAPSLRYCSYCRDWDLLNYGIPYWRSLHQLPMVHVCPLHAHPLIEFQIQLYERASGVSSLDLPPLCTNSIPNTGPTYTDPYYPVYKRFAEDMYSILHLRDIHQVDPTVIYNERCQELGYIRRRRIAQLRLANDFANHYGPTIVYEAGYNINCLSHSLLRRMRPDSPRHIYNLAAHLLMIGFLFSSFNEFINYKNPISIRHNDTTDLIRVPLAPRKLLTTRESVIRAIRLVKSGLSVTAASRLIKCSPEPIMLLASKMGLVPKPKWVRLCIGNKALHNAITSTEPLQTIAKRFGLCSEYIIAMLIVDVGLKEKRNASIKAAKQCD